MLGTPTNGVDALVEVLTKLQADGKIGNKIAMVSVADQFGIELSPRRAPGFKTAGFKLALRQDLSDRHAGHAAAAQGGAWRPTPIPSSPSAIRRTRSRITDTARVLGYNPKVFYTARRHRLPDLQGHASAPTSRASWASAARTPTRRRFKAYVKRHHEAISGREPDRWASPVTYASLQMLQQAIERVGKIDRAAVIKELQTGTFDTIIGKIKLVKNHAR